MNTLKRVSTACLLTAAVVFSSAAPAPALEWGTSYAYSTESVNLWQKYHAKAAGNVYNGERIIQVCAWFTRGSAQQGTKKCSNAISNNGWHSGSEVNDTIVDTLLPGQPKTILNISTHRVAPQIN